jgi:dihydrofolate reductase
MQLIKPLIGIVAVNPDRYIGTLDNSIPWSYGLDFKYFKTVTEFGVVVMGRKTFESMGCKPLSNRLNIVLTSNKQYEAFGSVVVHSLPQLLQVLNNCNTQKHFCIGGGEVFNLLREYICGYLLTVVPDYVAEGVKLPHTALPLDITRLLNADTACVQMPNRLQKDATVVPVVKYTNVVNPLFAFEHEWDTQALLYAHQYRGFAEIIPTAKFTIDLESSLAAVGE